MILVKQLRLNPFQNDFRSKSISFVGNFIQILTWQPVFMAMPTISSVLLK